MDNFELSEGRICKRSKYIFHLYCSFLCLIIIHAYSFIVVFSLALGLILAPIPAFSGPGIHRVKFHCALLFTWLFAWLDKIWKHSRLLQTIYWLRSCFAIHIYWADHCVQNRFKTDLATDFKASYYASAVYRLDSKNETKSNILGEACEPARMNLPMQVSSEVQKPILCWHLLWIPRAWTLWITRIMCSTTLCVTRIT